MTEPICSHRWMASRLEVQTVPVEHVCGEPINHPGPHVCCCGVKQYPGLAQ